MVKLLILDVDGILTDGTKFYNKDHEVLGKDIFVKTSQPLKDS